jgi:hypothetical protein
VEAEQEHVQNCTQCFSNIMQGGYGNPVSYHEFGHNLGLMVSCLVFIAFQVGALYASLLCVTSPHPQHSNRWEPYQLSNIEYGDDTTVMGSGGCELCGDGGWEMERGCGWP